MYAFMFDFTFSADKSPQSSLIASVHILLALLCETWISELTSNFGTNLAEPLRREVQPIRCLSFSLSQQFNPFAN